MIMCQLPLSSCLPIFVIHVYWMELEGLIKFEQRTLDRDCLGFIDDMQL